ncbi:MAG: 50S ribosomal protein L13 [Enterobacterales bacterium]
MKTFTAKLHTIKRIWYIADAKNKILGRFATQLALYLRGKHKPTYTQHLDTGDYIIVINADKIIVTGNKYKDKSYFHHTGYVGGIKKISFKDMMSYSPKLVLKRAVKGMLPKGPLGRDMLLKLKIYTGTNHCHSAQKPQNLNI